MVLVTLGTQDKPFTRLLDAVEEQIRKGNIIGEVIAQTGSTKYNSYKMRVVDYISDKEFSKLLKEADYIITHGGVASIIEGLNENKKIIAVARKKEYGEHVNNHQEQIVENFGEQGYILPVTNLEDLEKNIKKINMFKPKKFNGNNEIFLNEMTQEIEKLLASY